MEGLFGAVVVNEVSQHVARELINPGIDRMGLIDYFASKDLFWFFIHGLAPD